VKQGIVIRLLVGDGALSAKMQDYVLIAGCDEHGAELYAEMARAEGLQAIVAHEAAQAPRIVAERGAPRSWPW